MATPKADSILLDFRRQYGDLRDKTTGAVITNANQDGNDISVVQGMSLLRDASNELMRMFFQELGFNADKLGVTFPEARKRALLSGGAGGGQILYNVSLPPDFGWVVSAMYRHGNDWFKVVLGNSDKIDAVIEGLNVNHTGPVGHVEGSAFYLAFRPQTDPTTDKIELSYIRKQLDIEQGGTTDMILDARWADMLVKLMVKNARMYKNQ